jgi:hypothetical protein
VSLGGIFMFGYSLGSAIDVHVAAHRETAGLVLRAPPSSLKDIAEAFRPRTPVVRVAFPSREAVRRARSVFAAAHR